MILPILSICIPTYNRQKDLELLLISIENSINSHLLHDVIEIIISDNASDDDTKNLVPEWKKRFKNFIYVRNDENIGFALNINQAVSYARSPYCWLMGSDEQVIIDAIPVVIDALISNCDVIIGDAITNGVYRKLISCDKSFVFDVNNIEDFSLYIDACKEVSSAFAFISTLIVKKDFWVSSNCSDYELQHPYTHMFRICRQLIINGGSIFYTENALVLTGSNVNEWNANSFAHLVLDAHTINYICKNLFVNASGVCKSYADLFRRQYKYKNILYAKWYCDENVWSELSCFLNAAGYAKFVLKKTWFDTLLFNIYLIRNKIYSYF